MLRNYQDCHGTARMLFITFHCVFLQDFLGLLSILINNLYDNFFKNNVTENLVYFFLQMNMAGLATHVKQLYRWNTNVTR